MRSLPDAFQRVFHEVLPQVWLSHCRRIKNIKADKEDMEERR